MSPIPVPARIDPHSYTPAGLPAEFRAYDGRLDHLGVGCAGKVGVLDLDLAPVGGLTRVVRHFQQLPLYFFHPLYIDAAWPEMAFLYALQAGDGIVQGDRYRLDLNCAPGSAVHFTNQAATKIYGMDDNFATQVVNVKVGAGAFVEYLPDPVLPFRGSRFYQQMLLTVDPDASAIVGETLLPGRAARGEIHAYDLYYADTEVRAPDGTLLFADRLKLFPREGTLPSAGLFGRYLVFGALYVISRRVSVGSLADRLHACLANQPEVLAGVSELPNGCGANVRALGHTSAEVATAMRAAWNGARLALGRPPAPDLRKG